MHRHIRVQQSGERRARRSDGRTGMWGFVAPGELLLEIRIARPALLPVRPMRRRNRQLPHQRGKQPVCAQGSQRRGRGVRRARVRHQRRVRVGVHARAARTGIRVCAAPAYRRRRAGRTRVPACGGGGGGGGDGGGGGQQERVKEKGGFAPHANVRV